MALIRIEDEELRRAGIPFKASTLYRWRKDKRNLEIFVKVGGRVFVDSEAWEKFVEKAREKSRAEAERVERLKRGILQ